MPMGGAWLLLGAFIAGGLLRAYEEWWRVRVRGISDQFNRDESARLLDLARGARLHQRALLNVALVLWPEGLVRYCRRRLSSP
jgi:hypothetical protein